MPIEHAHILIVEDSETHAEMLRERLQEWNPRLDLTLVRTLEQARAFLDQTLPDLAIIDYLLPDGKGVELLAGDAGTLFFPSIVITNHGDEQVAVDALKSGALNYLSKSQNALLQIPYVVQDTLREWRHRQELNRAEQAQRASEEKYRQLFLNMSEAVAIDEPVLDAAGRCVDWRILEVNPAFEQVIGIPRDQALGRLASELYGPDFDYSALLGLFDQVAAGAQPQRVELWFPRADRYLCVSLFFLGSGCFATVSSDVTERKRAQADRERLLAELDATINAIAEAVVIYDPEGGIRHMNPAAEALLVYSAQERGRPLEERCALHEVLTSQGEEQKVAQFIRRALAGERLQGLLSKLHCRDGKTLWVSSSLAPIKGADGQVLGAVGTTSDVSGIHELQKQRDLYLHTISHDLRLPLTVIYGYAQILQEKFQDCESGADALQFTDEIIKAAQKMTRMTEDLVDLARLEGGQLTLNRREVCLGSLVARLIRSSAASLATERIEVDLPLDLPPVSVDVDRIERVILNLLSNALKYSQPPLPVKVLARVEGSELVVEVVDQGMGIAPEDQPRIFEQYYRPNAERISDSVGLGLYISRMLVEAHGGRIRLRSTPGCGSTFFFALPL